MRLEPSEWDQGPLKGTLESALPLLPGHKRASVNQEAGSPQTRTCRCLDLRLAASELGEVMRVVPKPQVCGSWSRLRQLQVVLGRGAVASSPTALVCLFTASFRRS